MLIIDGTILSNYADEHSKESQSLLPELVTTTIMNEHNEDDLLLTVFGSILGRSQIGDDGIFPHEFVRSYIEQSNNKNSKT